MKGSYILLIEFKENVNVDIGKLGNFDFKKGFYVYIGSALNCLESRINRHLKTNKKFHWHIDYLLDYAEIIEVYYKESLEKKECKISGEFENRLKFIKGVGCSDCKCKSHLYIGRLNELISIIKRLKMKKYSINEKT